MDRIFNQFSFILGGLILLATAALLLLRRGFTPIKGLVFLVLTLLLVGAWVVLHPAAPSQRTADQIRAQIGAGQPVLLEFLSPY